MRGIVNLLFSYSVDNCLFCRYTHICAFEFSTGRLCCATEKEALRQKIDIGTLEAAERACAGIGGFDGWMIGIVRIWWTGCGKCSPLCSPAGADGGQGTAAPRVPAPASACLVRRGPSVSVIETAAGDISMRILLIRPAEERAPSAETAAEDLSGRKALFSICISRGEAQAFLHRVGDANPLHRGNGAVLPGFLILNRVLAQMAERGGTAADGEPSGEASENAYEFRFTAPLFPMEPAVLCAGRSGFSLTAGGREIMIIRRVKVS